MIKRLGSCPRWIGNFLVLLSEACLFTKLLKLRRLSPKWPSRLTQRHRKWDIYFSIP